MSLPTVRARSSSGLVIRGEVIPVLGLLVENFLDDPAIALAPEDGRRRITGWVRCIIVHTTEGIPGRPRDPRKQYIIPGEGEYGAARAVALRYKASPKSNAADLIIGRTRGECIQIADLVEVMTFHARSVNPYSVGIEIVQEDDGGIYEAALDTAVICIEALCRLLGIRRAIHAPYRAFQPVPRLVRGGRDCVGVFGHRDQTDQRYLGDPGDFVGERLLERGFEANDYARDEDLAVVAARQREIGVDADGIAGPQTVARLKELGYPHGLWTLKGSAPERALDVKHLICRALGCGE